jgi:subtilisin family serine protease
MPDAWVFGNGVGMVVGVLDTGIMVNHPDLAQSLWVNPLEIPGNGIDDDGNGYIDDVNGYNFVGDIDSPLIGDQNSHGTHVAGIIAAQTNNFIGIAGVAGGAKLQIVKVLNSAGIGTYVDLIQGIIYAANNGANILNFSLGGPDDGSGEIPLSLHAAILYAQSKGCVMVASAGNEAIPGVLFPAAFPEVLAVTATDASGAPFFSRYGPEVDLNAPGVEILSPSTNGSYGVFSGTSAAAPHVSGVAALVWALQPSLTASEVMNLLESTTQDIFSPGWDPFTGSGRVDALNAVLTLLNPGIAVTANPPAIQPASGQGIVTARITDSNDLPVADGLTVAFSGDGGISLNPNTSLTVSGEAYVSFSSSVPGIHEITARIGPSQASTIQVEVYPWLVHYPIFTK